MPDTTAPPGRRPVILLLAAPATSAMVLYGLYDVLTTVGAAFPEMVKGTPGNEILDVRIVSADGQPFACAGGIPVQPHGAISAFGTDTDLPDAVIVCDRYVLVTDDPTGRNPEECGWLRGMHAAGVLLSSVCSGALVLAEAGVLDGRAATAHWAYRDLFRRHYPAVEFLESAALCLNAAEDGIVTAGAVSAWQDLAFFLIARFCGYRHAVDTAKIFLLADHVEGQSPYAVMTRPMEVRDALVADCQSWIAGCYEIASPVERMTERSGLGSRTFARRFRAATGYTPMDYVQALRVEEAKQELERTQTPVEEIAAAVGYGDAASFRRVFKKRVGLTPAAYRRKFRNIAAIAAAPAGTRR
ncbi:GlxA family transcriptional regulator [Mangrovicoccus ximenensis]|uniref:GlxA family transcriptional regulator n=1 Tax=Mangrovicoccus ximenensis TaxID=1911570 RepID=UPI000D374A2D|nr:helix-turn-helix domain-containing protein [Mangrovicoccus ximenensis]